MVAHDNFPAQFVMGIVSIFCGDWIDFRGTSHNCPSFVTLCNMG